MTESADEVAPTDLPRSVRVQQPSEVAVAAAMLAFIIGKACGLPTWTTWHPGDACDVAVFTGVFTHALARFVKGLANAD